MHYDPRLHLLLDPRIVEKTENARLAQGVIRKDRRPPFFAPDRPWEIAYDNLYPNVMYDEEEGLWKCWYETWVLREEARPVPPSEEPALAGNPKRRQVGLAYATSRDGATWEKPDLGVVPFDGSTANNLVMRRGHGPGVYKDPRDPDPRRRYKALMAREVAFSPDGIRWTHVECPEIAAPGDTHNNAFFDERTGKWVGITRLRDPGTSAPRYAGHRLVGRTESEDFVHWSAAEVVLRAHPDHPDWHPYAHLAFPYGDYYLALVMVLESETMAVHCALAGSPDTIRWDWLFPGEPFIPRGEPGDGDEGCIYAAAYPVARDERIHVYYGGCEQVHKGIRSNLLRRSFLRMHGWAAYVAADRSRTADIVTRPVRVDGLRLLVTADAAAGRVRAEIIGADGFALDRCDALSADVTDAPMTWRGADLAALEGRDARIRFVLDGGARLYAFRFGD